MSEAIRTLLVHLDGGARMHERLQLARGLALRLAARVEAMYATVPPMVAVPAAGDAGAVWQAMFEVEAQWRDRARAAYDACLGDGAVAARWFELAVDAPVVDFARQALYADLLVLAQTQPGQSGAGGMPADFPEATLLASGRPGLLVPYAGRVAADAATVVVAWKPCAQAARAVTAALPLLRRAARVQVLAWGDGTAAPAAGPLDLIDWLDAQGVRARWHDQGPEPQALGELLLSRCADLGAELLVMGCYGHHRAREWILGGASRTVLRSMTLPVLMAH